MFVHFALSSWLSLFAVNHNLTQASESASTRLGKRAMDSQDMQTVVAGQSFQEDRRKSLTLTSAI
jgi:hypothetical protein